VALILCYLCVALKRRGEGGFHKGGWGRKVWQRKAIFKVNLGKKRRTGEDGLFHLIQHRSFTKQNLKDEGETEEHSMHGNETQFKTVETKVFKEKNARGEPTIERHGVDESA